MKIENAIILAAGRGSRMKEKTKNKPKCMIQINKQSIIQRTIEVLKYKNINNITVVTGYYSDKLVNHLKRIDRHIHIIENANWQSTNSIASMKLALPFFKNAIVIDSDIYINNPDCILNDVKHSGYTALKANKPSEWQLIANCFKYIKKVERNGSYKNGRPIIDISYWLEKDCNIVESCLRKACDVSNKEAMNKFWDEIPLLDFLHLLKLKRYDIDETDAMEFDTPEELQKVRKIVCSAD